MPPPEASPPPTHAPLPPRPPLRSEQTRGKITDLVDEGGVARSVAVLVSAVYFKVGAAAPGRGRGCGKGWGWGPSKHRGAHDGQRPPQCVCAGGGVSPVTKQREPPPPSPQQGLWSKPFLPQATAKAPFALSGGGEAEVAMMHAKFDRGQVRLLWFVLGFCDSVSFVSI